MATNDGSTVGFPASTGQSEDNYKQLADKLEREKRGMYEEMKAEREKRQSLEEKMGKMEQEFNQRFNTVAPVQGDDNLAWITTFAQKPKEVLRQALDEYTAPLRKQNQELAGTLVQREALEFLAEEEGTTVGKLKKGDLLKELERVGKEHNLATMPMIEGTKAAYRLYQMEKKQKEDAEKTRDAAIQGATTQPPSQGAPASNSQNGRLWKESEIAAMPWQVFQQHAKDIALARAEGRLVIDLSKPNDKGRLEVRRNS